MFCLLPNFRFTNVHKLILIQSKQFNTWRRLNDKPTVGQLHNRWVARSLITPKWCWTALITIKSWKAKMDPGQDPCAGFSGLYVVDAVQHYLGVINDPVTHLHICLIKMDISYSASWPILTMGNDKCIFLSKGRSKYMLTSSFWCCVVRSFSFSILIGCKSYA